MKTKWDYSPDDPSQLNIYDRDGQLVCTVAIEAHGKTIVLVPEMLAVIPKLLKALDIAIDRSDLETGDTFGIHHNAAMDAIDEAQAIIAKINGGIK